MNQAYNQQGGTCSVFSLANGIEHTTGVKLTEDEIYSLLDDNGYTRERGTRVENILRILQEKPIRGVKCVDWEKVYSESRPPDYPTNKFYMSQVRQALLSPNKAVILGLWLRDNEGTSLPLDDEGALIVTGNRKKYKHYVHLEGVWYGKNRKQFGYTAENSWGTKFGLDGYFHIRLDDIFTEAIEIVIAEFNT